MIKVSKIYDLADLAGQSDVEQAQVDMIVDCMEDIAKPMMSIFHEPDETKKVSVLLVLEFNVQHLCNESPNELNLRFE